jgi:ABC-type multidrug transport system permease subunit
MVFLDEPTSGLDSFTAVQVCKVLKRVANSGASVLFTIHQPSSEMFKSFDRLILLHKGRVLFQGPCRNVPSTFAACGYPLPENYNPADWVVHVAQTYPVHKLEATGFYQNDTREVVAPIKPHKGQNYLGEPVTSRLDSFKERNSNDKPPGMLVQVNMLYKRELTFMYRFPQPLYARFGFTALLSSLIGMIFWKVGQASYSDPFNILGQFGTIMILLMLAMLGTAQPALLLFPEERPIFLREYSTDHYSVMSYFISRLVVEMIITGIQVVIMTILIYFMVSFNGSFWVYLGTTYGLAMSGTAMAVMLGVLAEGDAKVAQQLLPIMFIPQLLSSGFFVSPSLMPTFLQWAQYVSVLAYAVKILILEEFYNCSDNAIEKSNCQNLIDNVGANPDQIPFYVIMLVVYFLIFRAAALYLLRKSAMRFY